MNENNTGEEKDTVTVTVEKSAKTHIMKPEYLLQMDKLFMKNGEIFLVTKAGPDQIELMMVSRKVVKKENIQEFMDNLGFVERSECFEKG
jgi:hypothetical protein